MKNKTLLSLLCTGVLTVTAVAGATGFASASKDTSATAGFAAESDSTASLLSSTEDDGDDGYLTVEQVAEKVLPSVVTITNTSVTEVQNMYGYGFGFGWGGDDGYSFESVSVGSGIIVGENDNELLILTNNHVVEDATDLTVGFIDDEAYEAVVKGTDAAIDIAVVAVQLDEISKDTMSQIAVAEIGSSDDLMLGEQVVAIGNALGYGQSVTTGIVSALNRTVELDNYSAEMIQTDAAINGGNSGGPLLDMYGRVIGINSAKAAATGVEGMGYAIPISDVTDIVEALMNTKTRTETVDEERSAYIGISGQTVTEEGSYMYGMPDGIYITEVEEGSPADEAGLKPHYIITRFDSSSVTSMADLKSRLAFYEAGETVPITISYQEDGEYVEETIDLTLGLLSDYETTEPTEEEQDAEPSYEEQFG